MRLAGLGPPVGAGAHRGRNPESRRVHLPVAGVRCSIGIAYQAADAGHPNAGRASSPPSKETSPTGSILTRLHTAKAPIGRASPEESAGRAVSIPAKGSAMGLADGMDRRMELQQGSCVYGGRSSGNHGKLRAEFRSAAVCPKLSND